MPGYKANTATTTIAAAAAAAMVTMAGTIWFLSPTSPSSSPEKEVEKDPDEEKITVEDTVKSASPGKIKTVVRFWSSSRTTNDESPKRRKTGEQEEETTGAAISMGQSSPRKRDSTSLHRIPFDADPFSRFRYNLKPLRLEAWAEPSAESFLVRGSTYMKDGQKNHSDVAAFRLMTVDMIKCETPHYEAMCAHPRERVQQAIKRELESDSKEMPDFIFAVNLCIPAGSNQFYHQISYFAVDDFDEIRKKESPFGRLMNQFIFGDSDEFRDNSFKLIPRIVKGNILVRRAVGSKPSILGKKIKQYYFRGDRYFEMIVDIASDPVAQRIVKLALGYSKSLVTDICYVVEATQEDTLPERVFGGVALKQIDFKNRDGDRTILPRDCY